MTMKEKSISMLFLSLFVLMLGINSTEFVWDIPSHSELTLAIDWEPESESEETENGAEDPDKILLAILVEFDLIESHKAVKRMPKEWYPIHQEIFLPPPERS